MTPDAITINVLLDTGETAFARPQAVHETHFELVEEHALTGLPAWTNMREIDMGAVVRFGTADLILYRGPSGKTFCGDLAVPQQLDAGCAVKFAVGALAIDPEHWQAMFGKPAPSNDYKSAGRNEREWF